MTETNQELIFGKYEIMRRLAVGGMGEIFLARQHGIPGFHRLVILKNLLPDLAGQAKFIEQFLDEARVAATLNHPNIVGIFEVGLWDGVYFIAMEYIRGVSLAGLMMDATDQERKVPPAVAARIIHDVCMGLDHAHFAEDEERGPLNIVHRDISPQNIMVRDDGVPKVVDFGIAQAANRASKTATGDIKGKVSYLSPEQVLGKPPLDHRGDQFSLGIVFWELCLGQRLFSAENAVISMQKICRDPLPRPSAYVDGFPSELEQIIMQMLDRDRDKRFPRCRDVAAALRGYLDSISLQVGEPAVAEFVREVSGERIEQATKNLSPTGETKNFVVDLHTDGTINLASSTMPRPRRVWPWAAGGAGLVVIAGLVAALLFRPGPPPPKPEPAKPSVAAAPTAPTVGQLEVRSIPPGATVRAGALVLGQTPVTLDTLVVGTTHKLMIEKRGFETVEIEVSLDLGKPRTEEVRLKRLPARKGKRKRGGASQPDEDAATASPGMLTVSTSPWTMVHVDGRTLEAPFSNQQLPSGKHTLRFVNEAEKIDTRCNVKIESGKLRKVKIDFARSPKLKGSCPGR